MILNWDKDAPIYVIGDGVVGYEIQYWLRQDGVKDVRVINHSEFNTVPKNSQCMLGFVNIEYRTTFLNNHEIANYRWPTYIHPHSSVSSNNIGQGTVIYPMVCIGFQVNVGSFAIIGAFSSLAHGCSLGFNNVLCPDVVIGGSTKIGDNVFFGQRSSIRDKINVGSDIKFSMNSVVTKSVTDSGNYYGNKKILNVS